MAIKFEKFYLPENETPHQVEEDVWVVEPSPEQFGIRFEYKAGVRPEEAQRMEEIKQWLDDQGVWNISNLAYFNTEAERTHFLLTWL